MVKDVRRLCSELIVAVVFSRTFQAAVRIVNENTEMGSVYCEWSCVHVCLSVWVCVCCVCVCALYTDVLSHLPLPLSAGSSSEFLEAWLNLAEKLVNASAILESSHSLPLPPPSQTGGKKLLFNPLFNPLAFVIQAQKVHGHFV